MKRVGRTIAFCKISKKSFKKRQFKFFHITSKFSLENFTFYFTLHAYKFGLLERKKCIGPIDTMRFCLMVKKSQSCDFKTSINQNLSISRKKYLIKIIKIALIYNSSWLSVVYLLTKSYKSSNDRLPLYSVIFSPFL